MSRIVHRTESYVRLMDANGVGITSSGGAIDVTASFPAVLAVTSAQHDNFQVNANMQVGNIDVALGQYGMTSCLPVAIASDQTAVPVVAADLDIRNLDNGIDSVTTYAPTNSATLFDNATATADTGSIALDKNNCFKVSFLGTVSAACTFGIEVSEDNSTFYSTGSKIICSGADAEFHANFQTVFRYVRLNPGSTVTATVLAKCSA